MSAHVTLHCNATDDAGDSCGAVYTSSAAVAAEARRAAAAYGWTSRYRDGDSDQTDRCPLHARPGGRARPAVGLDPS